MSSFRLGLTLPSFDTWDADFAISVINLCMYMQKMPPPAGYHDRGLMILNRRSSILPQSRQDLVRDAIKKKCTHVLFIDSDQMFPADLAHRLAKHGMMFIGCNIATKSQMKSIPTARQAPGPGEWWGGHIVYSKGKTGVERVWRLGFGVMLINLEVFKDLPFPWFIQRWIDKYQEFVGEDWHFCELMEQKGIPVYVDHDASMQVGHVGRWIYMMDGCVPEEKKEAA